MKATATAARPREERLRQALFRGHALTLDNNDYLREVSAFAGELLASDAGAGDLTVRSLRLEDREARGAVMAKQAGVVAGLDELAWLYSRGGIRTTLWKKDGERMHAGEALAEVEGRRSKLLAYERVGLNLVQRMSGIATATRNLQERVHRQCATTQVVGTRKTPWGLLDKRAVHLGGGGTHRLGLWDAILVKNNHLALLAEREEDAVAIAARRAWALRHEAGFIEIEVRSKDSAVAAARAFADLQAAEPDGCPCLLLLDNFEAAQICSVIEALGADGLSDFVLLEASGNISEANVEEYASTGVDAISIGALTHSPRALDISLRIFSQTTREPKA